MLPLQKEVTSLKQTNKQTIKLKIKEYKKLHTQKKTNKLIHYGINHRNCDTHKHKTKQNKKK